MGLDIKENGFQDQMLGKAMESRFGVMDLSMKDGGRTTKPMDEED